MHCSFGFEAARNIVFQLRSRPDKGGGSGCYIQRKWQLTAQTAALIHHDVRVELAQNKVGAEEEAT